MNDIEKLREAAKEANSKLWDAEKRERDDRNRNELSDDLAQTRARITALEAPLATAEADLQQAHYELAHVRTEARAEGMERAAEIVEAQEIDPPYGAGAFRLMARNAILSAAAAERKEQGK